VGQFEVVLDEIPRPAGEYAGTLGWRPRWSWIAPGNSIELTIREEAPIRDLPLVVIAVRFSFLLKFDRKEVRGDLVFAARRRVGRNLYHLVHGCVDIECSD